MTLREAIEAEGMDPEKVLDADASDFRDVGNGKDALVLLTYSRGLFKADIYFRELH